jgi:hypothetical protein
LDQLVTAASGLHHHQTQAPDGRAEAEKSQEEQMESKFELEIRCYRRRAHRRMPRQVMGGHGHLIEDKGSAFSDN